MIRVQWETRQEFQRIFHELQCPEEIEVEQDAPMTEISDEAYKAIIDENPFGDGALMLEASQWLAERIF